MLHANVAPGIHRIEDSYTNWYIVEDGDRLTVLDSGCRRHGSPSMTRWSSSAASPLTSRPWC